MKFLVSLFLVVSLYSQVIDKIAIIVNNIPITSYDIKKTEQKLGIDKNQAIGYLIDKSILESAIKEKGIYVDDFDIDNEMQKIAQKNGMTLFNFKNYLLQKGELDRLKSQIKQNLEKRKLLETLNVRVTKDDVINYYNSHKNQFELPSKIDVTEYSSNDKQSLQEVINNPLSQNTNVEIKDITMDSNKVNPKLMQFLNKFDENQFTPIVNLDNKLVSFYIVKKYDAKPMPLKAVEGEIYQQLMANKSNQTLKDFIAKLKAKADIQFLN